MNILLSSVGRRSYLCKYFKSALGASGKVFAANSLKNSTGMLAADVATTVKASWVNGYVDEILNICKTYDIKLMISLHDLDGYILSINKHIFSDNGTFALLPEPPWNEITLDKIKTHSFLHENNFAVPWQTTSVNVALSAIDSGEVKFPLILKAAHGFGSLGLMKTNNSGELLFYHKKLTKDIESSIVSKFISLDENHCIIIQQFIEGTEHCVGILNDLDGHYVSHFACQVHEMRAGESDIATTVKPDSFQGMATKLSAITKHQGLWQVDTIRDRSGKDYILEINPRFTGDYPFHHMAGVNVPACLLAWMNDAPVKNEWLHSNPGVTGYKDLIPKLFR